MHVRMSYQSQCGLYQRTISFPEAAILLVSDGDRDLWPDGNFESANHGLPVTLRRIKSKPQTAETVMLWVILTSGCYAFVSTANKNWP